MNGITVLLASVALASLVGCAQTKVLLPHLSTQATSEWSAEEHRITADLFEEEAIRLEAKVAHLEKRVERFTKKPHLDPKMSRRQGWRRLIEADRTEISELREQMAWHKGEANQLAGVPLSKVLPPHLSTQAANEWSAEEHGIAADLLEEEAIRLEAQVAHLEKRVERFNKKPYLDPKMSRRQGWRKLMEADREEISELREHIAWHHGEAKRFNGMAPSEESEKREKGKTF